MHNQSKKIFSASNIIYGSLIVLLLFVTFNGNAKALLIQGLMKAGFFRPRISMADNRENKSHNHKSAGFKDMTFEDGQGHTFSLSSLKGKVVFINFWATWCPPCRAELPSISKLYRKFKDNDKIIFLMVDVDGKYKSSAKFFERHHYDMPVYTVEGDIPSVYLGQAIPTTVILNKEGRMILRHAGAANYDTHQVEKGLTQFINN
jgi:thiol-disulfide isomerase/thioredoxin